MKLYEDSNFEIIRNSRDYILIRKKCDYSFHSHFRKLSGCKYIISMFNKKLIPHKKYFRESMRRITTVEEFERFTEKKVKEKYRNGR